MTPCAHIDIDYEKSERIVRPYRWIVHTFRCTGCGVTAHVVDRERVSARPSKKASGSND